MQKIDLTQTEIDFINQFSKIDKSKNTDCGFQIIDKNLSMEINIFKECPQLCQVSVSSNYIRFSYEIFEYSPQIKKWLLFWAFARKKTNQDSKADIMATEALFDYCVNEKINGSFCAYLFKIFSKNPTHTNKQRLQNILETIKNKTNDIKKNY